MACIGVLRLTLLTIEDFGKIKLDKVISSSPPLGFTANVFSEVYSNAIVCSAAGNS